jgi:hypothetical protein
MSYQMELWLGRTRLWLPALLLVALNLALLFAYRLAVSVRLGAQEQTVSQQTERLEEVRRERWGLEQALGLARATADQVESLEQGRFGTEAERLTYTMAQVKRLAGNAGLRGMETITYPEEPVAELGLVRKSFVFTAQGGYRELRELINLLEMTDSFLVLEEIRVGGRETGGQLGIQLKLSTLFVDPRARGRA